jgi:hypothetical protein
MQAQRQAHWVTTVRAFIKLSTETSSSREMPMQERRMHLITAFKAVVDDVEG